MSSPAVTSPTLDELSEPVPPPGPADWNDAGVVILPRLMPRDLIVAYELEWMEANGWQGLSTPPAAVWTGPGDSPEIGDALLLDADEPGGWPDCTPYMRHPGLMDVCTYPPLAEALEALIGDQAGVHLNLTGWVSTERNWHQDGYLNPPDVGDYYAAVWIALGDVHPDSGPFQFIPGSHRWHRLVRERFARHVDMSDPQWPKHTETLLTPLVEAEARRRLDASGGSHAYSWLLDVFPDRVRPADGLPGVVSYLPRRGDVLIWHSRLYHRGSRANVPGAYRPGLIAHYSGINHHAAMPKAFQHPNGGWYFPIQSSGPVR